MQPDTIIHYGQGKTLPWSEYQKYFYCQHKSPFTLSCGNFAMDGDCFEARGLSARCIEAKMKGMSFRAHSKCEPRDADDFSRDYEILQKHPEWIPRLDEIMSPWSPIWSGLVQHWSVLTKLYEAKEFKEVTLLMKTIHRKFDTRDTYKNDTSVDSIYYQTQQIKQEQKEAIKIESVEHRRVTRSTSKLQKEQ
jgi:hypothetical protein